jgi:hypothetical protein
LSEKEIAKREKLLETLSAWTTRQRISSSVLILSLSKMDEILLGLSSLEGMTVLEKIDRYLTNYTDSQSHGILLPSSTSSSLTSLEKFIAFTGFYREDGNSFPLSALPFLTLSPETEEPMLTLYYQY